MGSIRPVERRRVLLAGSLLLASAVTACAPRPPRLVPPAGGVQAVEGYGSASVAGAEASIKGKFGFVFRRPGLGRVEAFDPIGRTVFLIYFRDGRAWFVLPARKVYAEDGAAEMMERFLGVALDPDDAVSLLSGVWPAVEDAAAAGGWIVEHDAAGRPGRGVRGGYAFTVRAYFPGDAVPREIGLEGPDASGRLKMLKLNFNPAPRDGLFDTGFLRAFAPKTWAELRELLDR